jgi:hypothetical protein
VAPDRLTRTVVAHRAWLHRALGWLAVALPVACLAAAALAQAGLLPVGARRMEAARFLALYAAPLFLAVPLWARHRLAALERLPATALVADVVVTALAAARFVLGTWLPFSGHMLFLAYSGLTVDGARAYRALALLLAVETTVFKLWLWRDVTSWALGLALGLLAAAIVRAGRPPSAVSRDVAAGW